MIGRYVLDSRSNGTKVKVKVKKLLADDHTLQPGNVTLLGCNFEVAVNDAGKISARGHA